MNKREQLLQVLELDIQRDCTDYQQLKTIMLDLYQNLLQRNCQQIDALNGQIIERVDQVRGRAERRSKILIAFGLGSTPAAMKQLFMQFPQNRRVAVEQSWQQLAEHVHESKHLNERNGKLLAMHNDILTHLLSNGHDNALYTPQYY